MLRSKDLILGWMEHDMAYWMAAAQAQMLSASSEIRARRWDPFLEKMVAVNIPMHEEFHAWPNDLISVELMTQPYQNEVTLGMVYRYRIRTAHYREWYEFQFWLPEQFNETAMQNTAVVMRVHKFLLKIAEEMCEIAKLDPAYYKTKIQKQLITDVSRAVYHKSTPRKPKEPEIDLRPYVFMRFLLSLPVIPEEVLHALYVQNEALKSQKKILEETERIKSLTNDHYQQYWNLIEKSKAYLSNFFS